MKHSSAVLFRRRSRTPCLLARRIKRSSAQYDVRALIVLDDLGFPHEAVVVQDYR
jgi:hypothetical protein